MTFKCDGRYGREVIIHVVEDAECLVCKEKKICLYADSSEEEYTEIIICRSCIDTMFQEKK